LNRYIAKPGEVEASDKLLAALRQTKGE